LKKESRSKTEVSVSLKKYSLEAVRYAAHAASSAARVFIRLSGRDAAVVVEFEPTGKLPGAKIAAAFKAELEDEKLRASVYEANRELRDFMILKALSASEAAPQPRQDDSGLTPEQEKELDALIAQVESEIKQEAAAGSAADPLGITKTWEDKYGAKKSRKKN
jgi:His-Xaa-Ser system protein HxsD